MALYLPGDEGDNPAETLKTLYGKIDVVIIEGWISGPYETVGFPHGAPWHLGTYARKTLHGIVQRPVRVAARKRLPAGGKSTTTPYCPIPARSKMKAYSSARSRIAS